MYMRETLPGHTSNFTSYTLSSGATPERVAPANLRSCHVIALCANTQRNGPPLSFLLYMPTIRRIARVAAKEDEAIDVASWVGRQINPVALPLNSRAPEFFLTVPLFPSESSSRFAFLRAPGDAHSPRNSSYINLHGHVEPTSSSPLRSVPAESFHANRPWCVVVPPRPLRGLHQGRAESP